MSDPKQKISADVAMAFGRDVYYGHGKIEILPKVVGTEDGPEGEVTANITPDFETGIGDWSVDQIAFFLKVGTKPDYEAAEGLMAEAIRDGLSHLSGDDLEAIAQYIKSLPPISNKVAR